MMHIEDRVLRRRLNVTHPAADAANIYVHIVVWIAFQRAAAARIETYLRHSPAGIDMRCRQRCRARVPHAGAIWIWDEKRTRRIAKGGGQLPLCWRRVVPIRQRPTINASVLPHDSLKIIEIHSMP